MNFKFDFDQDIAKNESFLTKGSKGFFFIENQIPLMFDSTKNSKWDSILQTMWIHFDALDMT